MATATKQKPRGVAREAIHEPIRETGDGRITVMGRDGQPLTRKRTGTEDPYHIDPKYVPAGWDYQWCRQSNINQPDVSNMIRHYENGWRPVPADRHAGQFMPHGHVGDIVRDGLILCERPIQLTEWARRDEAKKAAAQVAGQQEALQLGAKGKLPAGFSDDASRYAHAGAQVRQEIAPDPEIPVPTHELAAGQIPD